MSTKSQNLKRKQKGEFTNIENLEVKEKKIFTENNESKVVKKDFKPKDKKPQEGKQEGKKPQDPKKFKNKKMNKQLIKDSEKSEEAGEKSQDISSSITLGQLTQSFQKLCKKSTPEAEKKTIIDKMLNIILPVVKKVVIKREGSKAIQACMKYGTDQQKDKIFNAVLKADFDDIIKSKYGSFLALKMIKEMKNKDDKSDFFQCLLKNAFYLVSHVEGAKVVDTYLRNIAKPAELTAMKKVFDDAVKKGDKQLIAGKNNKDKLEGIENLALKIVDKSNHYPLISKYVLQAALPILVAAEREKVIEFLREKVLDLIEDKEGIKLTLDLINYASAKDRKIIIRHLKDHFITLIKSETNNLAYLVVQKLIHSLDDTVLIEKQVLKPIKAEFNDVIDNKHGFQLISSIFIPNHNALKTIEKEVKFTTSKKDDSIRLSQLQSHLIDESVQWLSTKDEKSLERNFGVSRFLSSIIKYILKENLEKHFDFVQNILKKFADNKQFKSDKVFASESLLNNIDSHRILKNIISQSGELSGKAKEIVDEYIENFNKTVCDKIELFVKNRSSIYLVIALIEQTSYKDMVVQKVKGLDLKKVEKQKTEGKDAVGLNILKNHL